MTTEAVIAVSEAFLASPLLEKNSKDGQNYQLDGQKVFLESHFVFWSHFGAVNVF